MTDFLDLFMIFCGSSLFYELLLIFVPVVLVSLCLSLVGVLMHGKSL